MENLKNKLDKYEIKDEKNKYVFRADFKYMISSSIFFIIIAGIAIHSLYKGISGIEKLTPIKIAFIVILLGYVVIAGFLLFSYKIVIENNEIFLKKIRVKMKDIEGASVKIMRVNSSKMKIKLGKKWIFRIFEKGLEYEHKKNNFYNKHIFMWIYFC